MNLKRFIARSLVTLAAILAGYSSNCVAVDPVTPQTTIIGPFGGLNTQDNPSIIGANQAQDLLNVDITPSGKSVKKRQGYAIDATLTYSTSAVHGLYKFFDVNGNEVRLAGQDLGLYSSVGGANWVRVATGTLAATWQCTDYLGSAYCVTSSRDTPVKTDGTTAGTSYTAIPAGTLIMTTPDRLVVGNTAANPSRLTYSGSVNFTDFTLGAQVTSSSFEDIAAPGSHLTHLAYHYGRWLWWKDQSFGFIQGTDQTNLQLVTVSDTVGTYDNTDVFWQGITYFRGTDNQIYAYDGAILTPISRDITPTVNSANRRKANLWLQTSQSDFSSGSATPAVSISTTISVGDVTVSSFTRNEYTTTSQWSNGSASNLSVGASSITLNTNNSGDITNASFESALTGNWYSNDSSGVWTRQTAPLALNCTVSPQSGSAFMFGGDLNTPTYTFEVIDISSNVLSSTVIPFTTSCSWTQVTVTSTANKGKRVRFRLKDTSSVCSSGCYLSTTDSYIFGGSYSFYYAGGNTSGSNIYTNIDNIQSGSSTITSGSFTSQVYDTGFTSATYLLSQVTYTVSSSTPSFAVITATAPFTSSLWSVASSTTGTDGTGNRYVKLVSTISVGSLDNAFTYISSWTIIGRSSGTYYSAVNNATLLTSWGNIGINDNTISNNGSIAYYVRASTGSFTVGSSTPLWVAQTKNATVNYSTGTYMQLRADFSVVSATEVPTLSDFTFNWFEGNAADKMYGTYYDYGIWFSVSLGTTTSNNNRILRYDLINQLWTVYDIATNGFLTYNNSLYFGSPSVGKIYKFGNSTTADDTANITAYWKTKDFFGASPFLDEDMRTIAWFVKESSNTMTVTYTTNGSSSTAYGFNAYSANRSMVRNNRNFPAGTLINAINFKIGDTSALDLWEVFAGAFDYVPRPWNASQ